MASSMSSCSGHLLNRLAREESNRHDDSRDNDDLAQEFLLLERASSQLRHFHHRSRRKVQWPWSPQNARDKSTPISDKIHKQGDYHPHASNACSTAHTCGSNVMHLNMWVSHGWIRDCSRICRYESTRLQHVSTRSGAEAANDSIQSIKNPHVFYKLQQGLKSGSGPDALILGVRELENRPEFRGIVRL